MKFGPVTKLDKKNTKILRKFDNDFMAENCDVIILPPTYGQFVAIGKPDSGRMVYVCLY